METPTTPTPNGHHLPPISDAGPRGPAPSGRTSFPPFPRRTSESDRQRSTQTPPGSRRCIQLVCRLRPRVGGRPAAGGPARRGHAAKGTRGRPTARTGGGGANPSRSRPASRARRRWPRTRAMAHPTNWADTPRGSPSQPQRSQTAGALRTRRDNGGTTRAARTKK